VTAPKWGRVLVARKHPRTNAPGLFHGTVIGRTTSGNYDVVMVIEGRTYRDLVDPANVRELPTGTGESA
jgi:hypothetical protein